MGNDNILQVDLKQVVASKAPKYAKRIPNFVYRMLGKLIHIDEINKFLRYNEGCLGVDAAHNCVKFLNATYTAHGLDKIDPNGRYIFVSNHPLGGLDGVVLSACTADKFNGNIRFVVNDLLMFIQPLAPIFVPVNKHGRQSTEAVRRLNETYASDVQMLYFPAGLCSRLIKGKITDLEWRKSFVKKAVEYKRDIVPVHFCGHNSKRFYRIAKWRKRLGIKFNIEMLLLPDEMFRQKNSNFNIYFGEPIPIETVTSDHTPEEWTNIIRERSYGAYHSTC